MCVVQYAYLDTQYLSMFISVLHQGLTSSIKQHVLKPRFD
jgi:hypothetical protein